jgi:hypothetical protein
MGGVWATDLAWMDVAGLALVDADGLVWAGAAAGAANRAKARTERDNEAKIRMRIPLESDFKGMLCPLPWFRQSRNVFNSDRVR